MSKRSSKERQSGAPNSRRWMYGAVAVCLLVGWAILGYRGLSTAEADALVSAGARHAQRKEWHQAIAAFKRAQPHCSEGHRLKVGLMLASLHTQTGRHREALPHYAALPSSYVHGSPELSRGLGSSLAAAGEDQAALKHFERSCALKRDFVCLSQLGAHMRKMGDVAGSVPFLRGALQAEPSLAPHYAPFKFSEAQLQAGTVLHRAPPHAMSFPGLLPPELCQELIALFKRTRPPNSALALGTKEDLRGVDADEQGRGWFEGQEAARRLQQLRWSSSGVGLPGQVKALDALASTLERKAGLPASHGLAWQLLEYLPGEGYHEHLDCVHNLRRADRMRTALLYLNTVPEGGHTVFPALGLSVAPVQGTLLLFSSQDREGFCNPRATHAAAPPGKGVKYVLQRWYSAAPSPKVTEAGELDRRGPHVLCDGSGSCREYFGLRESHS